MDDRTMDIYLIAGCSQPPKNLGPAAANAGPGLLSRLLARRPGFLGMELNQQEAADALAALRQNGARGMAVAAGYRTGGLKMEDALPIADAFLSEQKQRQYPDVPFEPTRFVREEALWWTFCRTSETLIERGVVPGALYAAIDKLGGHVWTEAEQAAFLAPD
jgi:hypothetical protein